MAHLFGSVNTSEYSVTEESTRSAIVLSDRLVLNSPSHSTNERHSQDGDPLVAVTASRSKNLLLIFQLTAVVFFTSFSTGLLTVSIPRIAADVQLPQHLVYWPSTVFGLTAGSLLLVAGAVADVVGSRPVNLLGNFLLGCFNLSCGLSRTAQELIAFRALAGVALALYLPSSVDMLSKGIAETRLRNIGFACNGAAQALGFATGLVIGGVLTQTIGWRTGFYLCGVSQLLLVLSAYYLLPNDMTFESFKSLGARLKSNIDWVGAGIACGSLAMLAYVLASITTSISEIRRPVNVVLLTISILLMPTFVYWVARQEKLHRPALIPNSIWKNTAFTSTCIMVLLSNAMIQTMELFFSLFFQQVQQLSPLQSSIRFLPSVLIGAGLNFMTGLVVHRISAIYLILVTSFLSTASPLCMALIKPEWPYWYDAFPAQMLLPMSIDVLFTVGILIVSDVFPQNMQALAGAVFNTITQFGCSIGLAIAAVISSAVTQRSASTNKQSAPALMAGYRAAFWACFAWMVVACAVGAFGLRKVGKVGLKKD